MEIEEAQAILRSAARRQFVDWVHPNGQIIEVQVVYPADLPAVPIRLLPDQTWEYAE